jgi:serine/threonine protein kinase
MAIKLRPQLARFFEYLSVRRAGEVVTEAELLAATGWKPATLETHRTKHKLDPFLTQLGAGRYRVVLDGATLSKGALADAFSQVSPEALVLTQDLELETERASYSLVRFLGNGAVAHVWEALDPGSRTAVAIKIMLPRLDLLDPTKLHNVRERFRKEARNGMNLDCPSIVRYRDVGEISGQPFIVMDLADESVAAMLTRGPLSLARSLEVIQPCLSGLDYLHGKGCVHRDIKPANVLRYGDTFVLGDLGIVQWSDMNPEFTSAGTTTASSIQLGSWYYMAPEQRRSAHHSTSSSDIYALGVTWYELLTGRTLDPAEVAAKDYPPPTDHPAVSQAIREMLEFRPAARPSIADLARVLNSL